jgi:hypothetical protein
VARLVWYLGKIRKMYGMVWLICHFLRSSRIAGQDAGQGHGRDSMDGSGGEREGGVASIQ